MKRVLLIVLSLLPLLGYAQPSQDVEMVDLGLSVYWASHNVGASTPEDIGYIFLWGDIVGYSPERFKERAKLKIKGPTHLDCFTGNSEYDAATAHWGGNWRTPTVEEIEELIYECKWEKVKSETDDKKGKFCKVTGPNQNYIILPYTCEILGRIMTSTVAAKSQETFLQYGQWFGLGDLVIFYYTQKGVQGLLGAVRPVMSK